MQRDEQQCPALRRGQAGDRCGEIAQLEPRLMLGRAGQHGLGNPFEIAGRASAPAQGGKMSVAQDREGPGPQIAVRAKAVEPAQRPEDRLLNKLLGDTAVARKMQRVSVQLRRQSGEIGREGRGRCAGRVIDRSGGRRGSGGGVGHGDSEGRAAQTMR